VNNSVAPTTPHKYPWSSLRCDSQFASFLPPAKMFITRAISLTNFFVATSALGFQVCVLYPWHKQLEDDFEALKKEHLRVLDTIKSTNTREGVAKPKGGRLQGVLSGLGGWRL